MSRRRSISTDISIDKKYNRLVNDYGVFAGLLYTLMIPHAEDDTTITGDADEIMMMVIPGMRKIKRQEVEDAIKGMVECQLLFWLNDVTLFFPAESFYKHQSYIPQSKRVCHVSRETPQIAEEHRESPQNPVSPSPSPSLTPTDILSDSASAKKIIDYLNQKAGTQYRHSSAKTKDLIKARMNEGFTEQDFFKVIDNKCGEWLTDEKMCKFLRPETLFSNKFEGYLNQKTAPKTSGKPLPANATNFKQREYGADFFDKLKKAALK